MADAIQGLPPGATLVSGTVPDQQASSGGLPPGATLVSGNVPPPAAPPAPGTTGVEGALNKIGEFGAGIVSGAVESMGQTIQALPWVGKKILSPDDMRLEREYFKPGSPAEQAGQTGGAIAEPVLEFVLGDEALKGVALAEKLGIASRIAKIAQDSPYIGKLLQHGVNAARMGTVGAAEATAKGATPSQAVTAGILTGVGGEAIPAVGSTIEKAAPVTSAVADWMTKLKNPFRGALDNPTAPPAAMAEAAAQPVAQAGVKAAAPTVGASFRSGIDVDTPFKAAKQIYQTVDDAAKTDFKILYEKLDTAQDAARIAAPGSPEEAVAQRNIKATEDSIADHKAIAAKSGVPDVDKTLALADAKFAETQANKDFNTKFFGNQGVISGNVAHGVPETINVDKAIDAVENLDKPNKFGVSRLQQTSLGKDGAFKLKQYLYDAQKAGKTALDQRTLRNLILKISVPVATGALGLGYELTK